MPPAAQVSVSEYLATTYEPDCDYVDGEIVERNLGEKDHSKPQTRLAAFFTMREAEWGLTPLVEQRVQVSPTRFRVPDVCALLATAPDEQIITHPPFLRVEILSKDDLMSRTQEKIRDYLK